VFIINEPDEQIWPIKVWLENISQLDAECLKQAKNLSNLPFAHKWIALMPDTHSGFGMPIGGVVATEGFIIPNAVGVDIGCGMVFVQTDIPAQVLLSVETPNGKLGNAIIGDILRTIPTGFEHHKQRRECAAVRKFEAKLTERMKTGFAKDLIQELPKACYQVGTLGSGNHFIELQTNEEGKLGIMVHSGSRNVGFTICHFFNNLAKRLNREWSSPIPAEWDLAYLPTDTDYGEEYIKWMNFALEFAKENRAVMMQEVIEIVLEKVSKFAGITDVKLSEKINCHHNYASYEEHYGKKVWVHRKGAISARKGELGIIPGAMGSTSYLVRGRGNPESFCSCSHGAGRLMSRTSAKQKFGVQETIEDLKAMGVFLGKVKKSDVGEESRFAYKDLDFVIENELDLIELIGKLKTVAVVKG
jgi:tRNA-splicing ligase RtcB